MSESMTRAEVERIVAEARQRVAAARARITKRDGFYFSVLGGEGRTRAVFTAMKGGSVEVAVSLGMGGINYELTHDEAKQLAAWLATVKPERQWDEVDLKPGDVTMWVEQDCMRSAVIHSDDIDHWRATWTENADRITDWQRLRPVWSEGGEKA